MSNLFQEVVKISLLAHIQAQCGGKPVNPSSSTTHINPCPLCGHNDAFTYYFDTNSFKCFSCDQAGDIINFERTRLALESNQEAAKHLATQYGIDIEDPHPPTSVPIAMPVKKDPAPELTIDPDRAKELRKLIADHYHQLLLNNEWAVNYQTQVRGHKLKTLKQHRIGYSDGSLVFVQIAAAAGFTETDLEAVSLLKPKKGKPGTYWPAINKNRFVYPHFLDGEILHFSIKDPEPDKEKRGKWQIKRAGGDPEWLFYGQGALASPTIWLVEGEDDRLTCIEHGLKDTAAIIGNFNTPYIMEWLPKHADGKTFFLAFDPDKAGLGYQKKYTAAIIAGGGTVKSVMPTLETFKMDIDDILRAAENPKELIKEMIANAEILAPENSAGNAPARQGSKYAFESFDVLGETSIHSIAIWSALNRELYIKTLKDLTLDQLHQIGGWEVGTRVCRTMSEVEEDPTKITFAALKKHIIISAAKTQLGKMPQLGQGIHQLDESRLLLVSGKEAVIWNGTVFIDQTHPVIEGKLINWEAGRGWVNIKKLKTQTLAMTPASAYEIMQGFADQIKQWGFSGGLDTLLCTGWILAQIVQAAWVWRPHMWLTGPMASGKSLLTQLIERIFNQLVLRRDGNGLTEPGLRQELSNNMPMSIIDEFENSKQREKIIEILRSCGRGSAISKGSSSQTATTYYLRHMVLVCSIETGLVSAAEKYRYLLISTKKDPDKSPKLPKYEDCAHIRGQLVAYSLWAIRAAKELVSTVPAIDGVDPRMVESVAVPFSMIAAATKDPAEALVDNVEWYLNEWEERTSGAILEDEAALLQDILLGKIRVAVIQEDISSFNAKTIHVDRTVAQLLSTQPMSGDHDSALQVNGVRLLVTELFINPKTVSLELLTRTRWKGMNIRDILMRLPGAETDQQRIAGTRAYGITIPESTWNPDDEE